MIENETIGHATKVGPGASAFAEENGVEILPVDALVTDEANSQHSFVRLLSQI